MLIFTLVGYAEGTPLIPRIYTLNSQVDFAPQISPMGYQLTGVPQYAIYLLHRLYDQRMNLENLSALAAHLITETSTQDPKVGGPVHITQITPSGQVELDDNAINNIIKRNEEQNLKLRRFFFEGGIKP